MANLAERDAVFDKNEKQNYSFGSNAKQLYFDKMTVTLAKINA